MTKEQIGKVRQRTGSCLRVQTMININKFGKAEQLILIFKT